MCVEHGTPIEARYDPSKCISRSLSTFQRNPIFEGFTGRLGHLEDVLGISFNPEDNKLLLEVMQDTLSHKAKVLGDYALALQGMIDDIQRDALVFLQTEAGSVLGEGTQFNLEDGGVLSEGTWDIRIENSGCRLSFPRISPEDGKTYLTVHSFTQFDFNPPTEDVRRFFRTLSNHAFVARASRNALFNLTAHQGKFDGLFPELQSSPDALSVYEQNMAAIIGRMAAVDRYGNFIKAFTRAFIEEPQNTSAQIQQYPFAGVLDVLRHLEKCSQADCPKGAIAMLHVLDNIKAVIVNSRFVDKRVTDQDLMVNPSFFLPRRAQDRILTHRSEVTRIEAQRQKLLVKDEIDIITQLREEDPSFAQAFESFISTEAATSATSRIRDAIKQGSIPDYYYFVEQINQVFSSALAFYKDSETIVHLRRSNTLGENLNAKCIDSLVAYILASDESGFEALRQNCTDEYDKKTKFHNDGITVENQNVSHWRTELTGLGIHADRLEEIISSYELRDDITPTLVMNLIVLIAQNKLDISDTPTQRTLLRMFPELAKTDGFQKIVNSDRAVRFLLE